MADNTTYLEYPCRISICPPDVSTDIEYILNSGLGSSLYSPDLFVVEFGSDNCIIKLKPGQHIKENDVIGYINGVKVLSKINGTVKEVHERYFIGEYEKDITKDLNIDDLTENTIMQLIG